MREFILLPVAIIGGLLLFAIALLALPAVGIALWIGERSGRVRLGGWHRDDEAQR